MNKEKNKQNLSTGSRQEGFGLVEVVVSLTILTTVVLAFNSLASMAFRSWETAKNRSIAYNIIQDTFEEIRNIRDTNFVSTRSEWFDDLDDLDGLDEVVVDYGAFRRGISISNVSTDVMFDGVSTTLSDSKKKIEIEVTWLERSGDKSLKSTTYLTDWKGRY